MDLSKYIAYFRGVNPQSLPGDFAAKMAEFGELIQTQSTNHEQQTNSNPTGQPQAPPAVDAVQVTGANGYLHIAITHNADFYRGIHYHLEHDSSPNFTNPIPVFLGPARHTTIAVGNQTRYVRVAPAYSASPPGDWTYHGTKAQPTAVSGGGTNSGPQFLPSQGSGTGAAGVGLSGPGPVPYRAASGAPPTR